MQILSHIMLTAIDEAVTLFKKRKPSDRDTAHCRVPPLYAAASLSVPSEEMPMAFEFKVNDSMY